MQTDLENAQHLLAGLRDVEGVVGSAVLSKTGRFVARDFPAYVDAEALNSAGERIIRMADAFVSKSGEDPDRMTLRFAEHKLFVQTSQSGLLAILTASETNMPALRMAANLVVRRLPTLPEDSDVTEQVVTSPPPSAGSIPVTMEIPSELEHRFSTSDAPPPVEFTENVPEVAQHSPRPVYFRGRRVE